MTTDYDADHKQQTHNHNNNDNNNNETNERYSMDGWAKQNASTSAINTFRSRLKRFFISDSGQLLDVYSLHPNFLIFIRLFQQRGWMKRRREKKCNLISCCSASYNRIHAVY